jgi:isocitrate dehydrogenase
MNSKKNHRSLWRCDRPRNHESHLGSLLSKIDGGVLKLSLITNRGVKVHPEGMKETFCADHW